MAALVSGSRPTGPVPHEMPDADEAGLRRGVGPMTGPDSFGGRFAPVCFLHSFPRDFH